MYKTGNKPGIGTYACTNCRKTLRMRRPNSVLVPCPSCKNTQYIRVNDPQDAQGDLFKPFAP